MDWRTGRRPIRSDALTRRTQNGHQSSGLDRRRSIEAASTADRLIDEPFDDENALLEDLLAPYKSPQSNSRIFQFPPCRKLRNISPCIQVAESSQFANTGNEKKHSFPKMALAVPISGWQTTLILSSKVLLKSKRM